MPTGRWVAGFALVALVSAVVVRSRGLRSYEPATVHAGEAALALTVAVDAPGLDLARCGLRLTPNRHEETPQEHWGELGHDGHFHVSGLSDTDYRVELVARHDPSLVLARADFIRPRAEPFRLVADFALATSLHPGTD